MRIYTTDIFADYSTLNEAHYSRVGALVIGFASI